MGQLVSRFRMPRGQRQVRSAQQLTGPQMGVALKSHSQFFLIPVLSSLPVDVEVPGRQQEMLRKFMKPNLQAHLLLLAYGDVRVLWLSQDPEA